MVYIEKPRIATTPQGYAYPNPTTLLNAKTDHSKGIGLFFLEKSLYEIKKLLSLHRKGAVSGKHTTIGEKGIR